MVPDAAHVAFDSSERLGLRKVTSFVAPTPSDHCVRFASAVADDCATLASRRYATALPGPVFQVYPSAYHAFDVQGMHDHCKLGHMLAYDAAATMDAHVRVQAFLYRYLN